MSYLRRVYIVTDVFCLINSKCKHKFTFWQMEVCYLIDLYNMFLNYCKMLLSFKFKNYVNFHYLSSKQTTKTVKVFNSF